MSFQSINALTNGRESSVRNSGTMSCILAETRNLNPIFSAQSSIWIQKNLRTLGDVQEIFVIDGQQRLTTLSLLISALSRVIQEQGIDIGISSQELSSLYLFNENKKGESRYKQMLTQSDKETLMCLLEDRELPMPRAPLLGKKLQIFLFRMQKSKSSNCV